MSSAGSSVDGPLPVSPDASLVSSTSDSFSISKGDNERERYIAAWRLKVLFYTPFIKSSIRATKVMIGMRIIGQKDSKYG
jgi:hypothetical protein